MLKTQECKECNAQRTAPCAKVSKKAHQGAQVALLILLQILPAVVVHVLALEGAGLPPQLILRPAQGAGVWQSQPGCGCMSAVSFMEPSSCTRCMETSASAVALCSTTHSSPRSSEWSSSSMFGGGSLGLMPRDDM